MCGDSDSGVNCEIYGGNFPTCRDSVKATASDALSELEHVANIVVGSSHASRIAEALSNLGENNVENLS